MQFQCPVTNAKHGKEERHLFLDSTKSSPQILFEKLGTWPVLILMWKILWKVLQNII
jgi:hypothetical protein